MYRRPPRSTRDRWSAASELYKRQGRERGRGLPARLPARPGHPGAGGAARRRERRGDRGQLVAGRDRRGRRRDLHRRVGLDGPGAVSYTHLRAHETGLDLVCRLSLEKKKKKKIPESYQKLRDHDNVNDINYKKLLDRQL